MREYPSQHTHVDATGHSPSLGVLTSTCSFSCLFWASVSSCEEGLLKDAIASAMARSSVEGALVHRLPLFLFLPDKEEEPEKEEERGVKGVRKWGKMVDGR